MPTVVINSIGSGPGRDFATITDWEAATRGDLVAADEVRIGELYADSDFDELVTISGSTTDATRYRVLRAAATEKHDGTPGSGARIRYTGVLAAPTAIVSVEEAHARVEDLEVTYGGTFNDVLAVCIGIAARAAGVKIRRNLVYRLEAMQNAAGIIARTAEGAGDGVEISNNFVSDIKPSGAGIQGRGIVVQNGTVGATIVCANNTVHDTVQLGILGEAFGSGVKTTIVRNNISTGCNGTDFSWFQGGGGVVTSSNNLSSDATADDRGGSGHVTGADPSALFVSITQGAEDLHLLSTASAVGAGADLGSGDIAIDIDGYDRDAGGVTWDIGADQFVAVPTPPDPPVEWSETWPTQGTDVSTGQDQEWLEEEGDSAVHAPGVLVPVTPNVSNVVRCTTPLGSDDMEVVGQTSINTPTATGIRQAGVYARKVEHSVQARTGYRMDWERNAGSGHECELGKWVNSSVTPLVVVNRDFGQGPHEMRIRTDGSVVCGWLDDWPFGPVIDPSPITGARFAAVDLRDDPQTNADDVQLHGITARDLRLVGHRLIAPVTISSPAAAASGPVVLNAPAGSLDGDLWVACIHSADQVAHALDSTDWTEVVQGNGGGTTSRLSVWVHRYDGQNAPDLNVGHVGGDAIIGSIIVLRNVRLAGDPVAVAGTIGAGTGTSVAYQAISPAAPGCMVLAISGASNQGRTRPDRFWALAGPNDAFGTALGSGTSLAVHHHLQHTAAQLTGVEDTLGNSSAWAGVLIALAPEPIGGETPVSNAVVSPWEALHSIAAPGTAVWESAGTVLSSAAAPWESLLSVSMAAASAWETLAAAHSPVPTVWESLATAAPVLGISWESGGTVLRGALTPWESLRSASSVVSSDWESLATVLKAETTVWEALSTLVQGVVGHWESGGTVQRGAQAPWESLSTVFVPRSVIWESLSPAAQSRLQVWEALAGVLSSAAVPWESLGVPGAVTQTAVICWEAGGTVVSLSTVPWETVLTLAQSAGPSWESLVSSAKSSTPRWESLTGLNSALVGSWEASGTLVSIQIVPWESLRVVAAAGLTGWESLRQSSQSRVVTYEALTRSGAAIVVSWEAITPEGTRAFTAVFRLFPALDGTPEITPALDASAFVIQQKE